jgi:lipooligosaccharide transport system permease protein
MLIYRHSVTPLAFGLIEPVMYLLTIGFGVGTLVGTVPGVDVRYRRTSRRRSWRPRR